MTVASVEEFVLRLDGAAIRTPIANGAPTDILTSAITDTDGFGKAFETQLTSAFFNQDAARTLDGVGIAVLQFGTGRRLRASISLQAAVPSHNIGRGLQQGETSAEIAMEPVRFEPNRSQEKKSYAGAIMGAVGAMLIMVAAVAWFVHKKKKPADKKGAAPSESVASETESADTPNE